MERSGKKVRLRMSCVGKIEKAEKRKWQLRIWHRKCDSRK